MTELDVLEKALSTCRYARSTFTRTAKQTIKKRRTHRYKPARSKGMVVLPYIRPGDLREVVSHLQNASVECDTQTGEVHLTDPYVAPKDKTPATTGMQQHIVKPLTSASQADNMPHRA